MHWWMPNTINWRFAAATDLQSKETFYAFEEGFVKVWTELGGQVMQASLKKGNSRDKRKKTTVRPDSEK
jgi:hypothetical protein